MLTNYAMCVSTPLGNGSVSNKICKVVDMLIDDIHMAINMLVLCISNFDAILDMN